MAKRCNIFKEASGLMFTRRKKAKPLLFEFEKPVNFRIHSLFVFFPFVAIWLDEKNKIIEIKKIKPFISSIKPKKPYKKLLEIPLNKKYKMAIKYLSPK
ncbi:MAG: DUF192 domain-containing protein [Candidatus Pacearchaeota archaeon]|nr:DUF192 domain-containing protein [Candidatus Pacearchaeota archaeon]